MPGRDDDVALRTITETAVLLGVSRKQIYRLIERAEIDVLKVGNATRVTHASIDSYIAKRPVPKQRA